MAAIFGRPIVSQWGVNFLSRTMSPSYSYLFRRYAHTKTSDSNQTSKISCEVKEWLIKERIMYEQAKLEHLRDQVVIDGPPRPGDRFYDASMKALANKIKQHQNS